MFYGLICLSCFDVVTVSATFLTIVLVQVLNATLDTKTKAEIRTTTTTTTATTTSSETSTITNGKIDKQKSVQSDDLPTSASSSPPSSARNSINSLNNVSIPHTPGSTDTHTYSDEFQEDEDTLSLENLFPCDQSEIYASKKISFIIDELIQTEANYVNNLRKGLLNYGRLHERQDLPEALQGEQRRRQLLGNIEEIMALHEQQILPMMLRNQRDLKALFDEFATHFSKSNFYCYVIFTMNKKTSMQLRSEQREWLNQLQDEFNDRLGIDSFMMQPIQRLTRYPLLLQQFISEFYKNGISCKPVLMSVCKLETRLRRTLDVVNQAEEIPDIEEMSELDLLQQGHFRKANEFEAYHHRSRKKYRAKVYLFDECLLCVELRRRRLVYRQHYAWETLELQPNNSKSITVLLKTSGGVKEEYELHAAEAKTAKHWLHCAHGIVEKARVEAAMRGKFSLPMDLMLGVALAVWLIWHYLY